MNNSGVQTNRQNHGKKNRDKPNPLISPGHPCLCPKQEAEVTFHVSDEKYRENEYESDGPTTSNDHLNEKKK